MQAILAGAEIPAHVIVRASLASGDYGLSDAEVDLEWNGLTYHACGPALQVELAPTSTSGRPQPSSVTLSSTDADGLAAIYDEDYRARPCAIAVLLLDPVTRAPSGEVLVAVGRLDVADFNDAELDPDAPERPAAATLAFTMAPLSADLARQGTRRRSDTDQRLHRDAVDGFFKDVGLVSTTDIFWGKAGSRSPGQIVGGA